jgi:hypothetical protein
MLHGSLAAFEQELEERFRLARDRGEIGAAVDPTTLARLASAVLHSLAVRARAGEVRAVLEAIADSGVAMICAAAGAV